MVISLVAAVLLLGNLDDLFLLGCWLAGKGRRDPRPGPMPARQPRIAIWVACWREAGVIGRMLDDNVRTILYDNYRIYVGLYPNDPETVAEVAAAARRHPRIRPVIGERPGKSTKGDNLNGIYRQMLADEQQEGERFDAVVVHDAEDLIHKDELRSMARQLGRYAMIQMPVLALADGPLWIRGLYCEDFAYNHTVELPARAALGGFVPSAGVGTAYRRDLLDAMACRAEGRLFDSGSLTEDYDSGLMAKKLGARQAFVPMVAGHAAPTAEHFPERFWKAVNQRSRWIRGIILQGAAKHGWGWGSETYWFLHDRKGLLCHPLGMMALAWFAVGAVAWGLGAGEAPWRGEPVALANFAAGAVVLASRIAVVARVHGLRVAFGAVPRSLVAVVLNGVAVVKAVADQYWPRARSERGWVKTAHTYPGGAEVATRARVAVEEILVAEGAVTEAEIRTARATCPAGVQLTDHLLALGLVEEGELLAAVERESGLARMGGPGEGTPPPRLRVSRIFSAEVALQYQLLPIEVAGGELSVATPAPPGEEARGWIQGCTQLKVRFVLVTKREWREMARAVL